MYKNFKALIEQQFIIGKLKKEAKIFKKNNPQFSLMEAQDQVAKIHGFLHWHELHTLIKRKLEILDSSNTIDLSSSFFLGKEELLNHSFYLKKDFKKAHIKHNQHSQNLLFNMFKEIMKTQCKFIYCDTESKYNSGLEEKMQEYANENNIPLYYLSFTQKNKNLTLDINFDTISSGSLLELFFTIVTCEEDSDADMWKGRAISMGSCLFMALVWLRDQGEIKLTPSLIREYLMFDKFIELYERTDLPTHINMALKSYLISLPGFTLEDKDNHKDIFLEQHRYLQMQYIKPLCLMSDLFPYIFNNDKTFLLDVLNKQEKFILIVNFPSFKDYSLSSLFSFFYIFFLQSLTQSSLDKNFSQYSYYLLLEDIDYNINLPVKLLSAPVNFILNNNNEFQGEGFHLTASKNGISI